MAYDTACTCTREQLDRVGCDCHDAEYFANACYTAAYEDDAYAIEQMQDKAARGADLDYYDRADLVETYNLGEHSQRRAWTLQGHYEQAALAAALWG